MDLQTLAAALAISDKRIAASSPSASSEPPDAPKENDLWVDTGVSPTMMRRWRGADVTTEREYTQTRVGCGKNLCNSPVVHGTRSVSEGMFYSHAGTSTNRTSNAEIIPVAGGETYTLSWSGDDSNPAHLEMFLFYENETFLSYTQQSSPTVTIPANANGLGFNLLSQNAYTTDYITDVQLEMGSAATAYEPYEDIPFLSLDNAQGQIERVAVEAECRARQETRKNLCNSPVVHGTRSASDGTFYSHAGASTNRTSNAEIIPVAGGETYTLSWSGDASNPAHLDMFLFYENETLLSYTRQSSPTITIPANANGLGFNLLSQNAYTTDYITDVQLEMGSAATAYEPYKSVLPISGRESVEVVACGKNLLNPPGDKTISGLTYTLQSDGTYLVNGTITGISELDLYEGVLPVGQYTISGGTDGMQVALAVYKSDGTYIRVICTSTYGAPATGTVTALTGDEAYHRAFIQSPATVGLTLTNIAISPQLERGDIATAFEPYRPMGGGTVTPTEPLYGLPGAEDAVEVSVDGDVTVTRRTGYIASYNGESLPGRWTSSHDVYAEGATPTTGAQVVYELAAPTTETPADVDPIVPEKGQLNIFTDADALSTTVHGSGWDTISDQTGLLATIAQLTARVAALEAAAVSTINNTTEG